MKIMVVSPHPDDEVLGVGGSLLRYKDEGISIAWLIVTGMSESSGWSKERVEERRVEVDKISKFFRFDEMYNLGLPTTKLDTLPMGDIVKEISHILDSYRPSHLFIPHYGDVHTDHQIVHKAVASCSKWFRSPFVEKILSYETISETEFSLNSNKY